MKRAMERHEHGEVCVIPVILRPTSWERTSFSKLQALPKDAKPVTSWYDRESAFLNVAEGIRKVVEELTSPSSVTLPVTSLKPANSGALELHTPTPQEVPAASSTEISP